MRLSDIITYLLMAALFILLSRRDRTADELRGQIARLQDEIDDLRRRLAAAGPWRVLLVCPVLSDNILQAPEVARVTRALAYANANYLIVGGDIGDIRRELESGRWNVLYIISHARDLVVQLSDTVIIQQFLPLFKRLDLLYASTCNGAMLAYMASQCGCAAVAAVGPVEPVHAVYFASAFFESLASGAELPEAFAAGEAALLTDAGVVGLFRLFLPEEV